MKQLAYIAALFILSNSSIAMDALHQKKQPFNLPADIKREIQKKVFEDKTHNRESLEFPPIDRGFTSQLPTTTDCIRSKVWNELDQKNRHYYWALMFDQIVLQRVCTFPNPDERLVGLSISSLNSLGIQTDGPNSTHDVLVAGIPSIASYDTIYYNLKQIPPSHDKTIQYSGWHTIPQQKLVTIALSPSHSFAILGQDHAQQQILSWYRYDQNLAVMLANRTLLGDILTQMAFITPNVVLGLTTTKKLVTLWLDQNRLKFQFHKTPFEVERFAIDSQNPDFIAFTYYETKNEQEWDYFHDLLPSFTMVSKQYFSVAVSSLKNRDNKGNCIFKSKRISEIAPTYAHTLEFMNGVIIVDQFSQNYRFSHTIYWKIPAALFSTFLCKKN